MEDYGPCGHYCSLQSYSHAVGLNCEADIKQFSSLLQGPWIAQK